MDCYKCMLKYPVYSNRQKGQNKFMNYDKTGNSAPFSISFKYWLDISAFSAVNAEHIASRCMNINAVALWIVFCKYCSHRIPSPYYSINH